jgi:hypothetical protein
VPAACSVKTVQHVYREPKLKINCLKLRHVAGRFNLFTSECRQFNEETKRRKYGGKLSDLIRII